MVKHKTVRPSDEGKPTIRNHGSTTVEYLYERQRGQWNLVGIDYLCFDCWNQVGVEHPYLYEWDGSDLVDARLYMLGKLTGIPCE